MWTPGRHFSRRCFNPGCVFWKRLTRPALRIFVVALLMMVPGCCLDSSTPEVPVLPLLTSLQRLELNGTPGVWMNSDDAGRLAQWIYDVTDVTGENGQ